MVESVDDVFDSFAGVVVVTTVEIKQVLADVVETVRSGKMEDSVSGWRLTQVQVCAVLNEANTQVRIT